MSSLNPRGIDVVGVDNGSHGRSCTQHPVCGHFVVVDDKLYCKWAVQCFDEEKNSTCHLHQILAMLMTVTVTQLVLLMSIVSWVQGMFTQLMMRKQQQLMRRRKTIRRINYYKEIVIGQKENFALN
jgi:hypothetical protein